MMPHLGRAALLVAGVLAFYSVLRVGRVGVARSSQPWDRQEPERRPLTSARPPAGRRLEALDAETQQKQMRWYLGGLYPPVDADKLPLYLRDARAPDQVRGEDLVFFWHIPKASGSTVKNILNFCFDLKRAEQLEDTASMDFVSNNIVNMDTCSPDGLDFSFANHLVNSGKVDVIVSNYFLAGAALFTQERAGRTFAILRHPGEIALSLFHYRRKATWERSYRADFNQMTFRDYVSSEHYQPNWMVRQLTATAPWMPLTEAHLERAKRLLKRKVFVGELGQIDETLRQLQAHFGWEEREKGCVRNYLHAAPANANAHKGVNGGRYGTTWRTLVGKEKWDMSLYYYGLELFAEQALRYPPP